MQRSADIPSFLGYEYNSKKSISSHVLVGNFNQSLDYSGVHEPFEEFIGILYVYIYYIIIIIIMIVIIIIYTVYIYIRPLFAPLVIPSTNSLLKALGCEDLKVK